MGSQYTAICMAIYTIYMGFIKFKIYIVCVYVFEILLYTLSYVKRESKIIFIFDTGNQNIMLVFVSQEHPSCVSLSLNF